MSVYGLSNVIGAPYTGGKITFTPDGKCLLVPVGDRVSVYDLNTSKSVTLTSETRSDVAIIACHPSKPIAIVVDVNGEVSHSLKGDTILHRLQFKSSSTIAVASKKLSFAPLTESQRMVSDAKFSPDGKWFAIAIGQKLLIWKTPDESICWRVTLHRELTGHMDTITSLSWSQDSRFILTSSKDVTVRLWSVDPIEGFTPCAFVDHRRPVIGAMFLKGMDRIASISTEGVIIIWKAIGGNTHSSSAAKVIGSRRQRQSRDGKLQSVTQTSAAMNEEADSDGDDNEDFIAKALKINASTGADKTIDVATVAWEKETQGYCDQAKGSVVSTVAYSPASSLLLVGFTGGVFGLYTTPELTSLYTLKLGTNLPVVDSVDIISDGQWLALACSETAAVVVWEWKSETFVMRLQGHQSGIRSVAFSTSGNVSIKVGGLVDKEKDISADLDLNYSAHKLGLGSRHLVATGGFDGRVKLWDSHTGLNIVTFHEHGASVEAICYTPSGNAILTASLDGSVRAFDLLRFKNFKTLTGNVGGIQFISVACDASGTIVAAGSKGECFNVFIWNLSTGSLLDELRGHSAPVTSVAFHPHPAFAGFLVSGSWDRYLNVWNIFARADKGGATEPLLNSTSIAAIAFDPRGNSILAAAVLCGHILFWDLDNAEQVGSIDGLRDIQSGRNFSERFASVKIDADISKAVNQNQHFNSITYVASGTCLLAGSRNSPLVCVYNTKSYLLMYMITITRNRAYSGLNRILNSKYITEYGHAIQEYDLSDEDEATVQAASRRRIKQHNTLPGVQVGEFDKHVDRFHVWNVAASPDSREFAAATSHGLFFYTIDAHKASNVMAVKENLVSIYNFQPHLLTKNTTFGNVTQALEKKQWSRALVLALAINSYGLLLQVYEAIPTSHIGTVVASLDPHLVLVLLNLLRWLLTADSPYGTRHLHLHLEYIKAILSIHQEMFSRPDSDAAIKYDVRTTLLLLLRTLASAKQLVGIFNANAHLVKYLVHQATISNT